MTNADDTGVTQPRTGPVDAEPATKEHRRKGRPRRILAVFLVVLASLAVPLATTAVWARGTVVDTDEFVATVGPLIEEPEVQIALTDYLTVQIMTAVDVEALVADTLPARGQALAGPLEDAVEGFVHDVVDEIVTSERFAERWKVAIERAQRGAVAVLKGESPQGTAISVEGDEVKLNLIPAINTIFSSINDRSPEVLGQDITLPEITSVEEADKARAELEKALGRPLPEDFGQFTVFQSDTLTTVQDSAEIVQEGLILLLVVAAAAVIGALAVSRARRRTLLQLVVGIGLGLILVRRVGLRGQLELLELVKVETNRAAVEVISDEVLSGLLDLTAWMLIGLMVVGLIALVTGPYRWAVSLRNGVAGLGRATRSGGDQVGDDGAVGWARRHTSALQAAGAIAGGLIVLLFNLSWFWILVVILLVVLYELWLARLGPPPVDTEPTAGPQT